MLSLFILGSIVLYQHALAQIDDAQEDDTTAMNTIHESTGSDPDSDMLEEEEERQAFSNLRAFLDRRTKEKRQKELRREQARAAKEAEEAKLEFQVNLGFSSTRRATLENLFRYQSTLVNGTTPTVEGLQPHCATWACITENHAHQISSSPFNSISIATFAGTQFGTEAQKVMHAIFQEIRLFDPTIHLSKITTGSSSAEFKISGYLLNYMGVNDGSTKCETIYSLESQGMLYISTGITFPRAQEIEAEYQAISVSKSDSGSDDDDHSRQHSRRRHLLGSVGLTFASALSMFIGASRMPKLDFLTDHGDLGIRATQSIRLEREFEDSQHHQTDERQGELRLSSILASEPAKNMGIRVFTTMGLSKNNKEDCAPEEPMCGFLHYVLPKGMRLVMSFDSGYNPLKIVRVFTTKRLQAGLGNIRLHERLVIKNAGLYIELMPIGIRYGITGTMTVTVNADQELHFNAELGKESQLPTHNVANAAKSVFLKRAMVIAVKPQIIVAKLAMIGFWKRVFGIPFVHFGNVHGKIKFDPRFLPAFTALAVGAEIWLGREEHHVPHEDGSSSASTTFKGLRGQVYASMDILNPLDLYLYASFPSFTFQNVTNVVFPNLRLPRILGDNGLWPLEDEEGVVMSFSLIDRQVPDTQPPVTIQSGFRIRARFVLFGWSTKALVEIDWIPPNQKFIVLLEMEPLTFAGGLLRLYRSGNEQHLGPRTSMAANFSVKPFPIPKINIDGSMSLLGFQTEVQIAVNENGFFISRKLRLFNLVEVLGHLLYDHEQRRVDFYGHFELPFLKQVEKEAGKMVQEKTLRRRLTIHRSELHRKLQKLRPSVRRNARKQQKKNFRNQQKVFLQHSQRHDSTQTTTNVDVVHDAHRKRQLRSQFIGNFFANIGKGIANVATSIGKGVVAYGKKVIKSLHQAGKTAYEGIKKFGKGDVVGGFGKLGEAAIQTVTALLPFSLLLHKISFNTDLRFASNHKKFRIFVDLEFRVFQYSRKIQHTMELDLSSPRAFASSIVDYIMATFGSLFRSPKVAQVRHPPPASNRTAGRVLHG